LKGCFSNYLFSLPGFSGKYVALAFGKLGVKQEKAWNKAKNESVILG